MTPETFLTQLHDESWQRAIDAGPYRIKDGRITKRGSRRAEMVANFLAIIACEYVPGDVGFPTGPRSYVLAGVSEQSDALRPLRIEAGMFRRMGWAIQWGTGAIVAAGKAADAATAIQHLSLLYRQAVADEQALDTLDEATDHTAEDAAHELMGRPS